MLRGIPSNLPPELFKVMMEMGHGDEICFADANFPGYSNAARAINATGSNIPDLLDSVLTFLPIDRFVQDSVFLMEVMKGHDVEPTVWRDYERIIQKHDLEGAFQKFSLVKRLDFYERAKRCYAIVITGETRLYANIILKKGIVEPTK